MAPKAKAKGNAKAKSQPKAAKAEVKTEAAQAEDPREKAVSAAGTPAAGSGTNAVRQCKADAAAEEATTAEEAKPASASSGVREAAEVKAAPVATAEAASPAGMKAAATETAADAGCASEAKAEAKTDVKAEAKVSLSDIPDPWASVADEVAILKIRNEEWEIVDPADEPSAPANLAAKDADFTRFVPTEAQRQQLIAADFSGNSLPSIAAAGGPMWLRSLGLANNPLESLTGLSECLPRLVSLDVSFVELAGIDGAWQDLATCPRLRRLVVEGCGLASFEEMESMPALRILEAQDNAVETLEDVQVLSKRCPDLEELDLRENDVVTEGGYQKKVKAMFPKLAALDGQSQKAYVAKGQDEAYKGISVANKDINAVDGMWKNEGCSCLEGNPCIDPACCKDWKNRDAVAAEARKRKGLRDDFGKLLG